jgi:hypothetical protein
MRGMELCWKFHSEIIIFAMNVMWEILKCFVILEILIENLMQSTNIVCGIFHFLVSELFIKTYLKPSNDNILKFFNLWQTP